MMVDHLEQCSAHVQCLRSVQCTCTKHTSAKQKSLLDGSAFHCQGSESDNRALCYELSKVKIM